MKNTLLLSVFVCFFCSAFETDAAVFADLNAAVSSAQTDKTYTLTADETINAALGDLGGKTLSIIGNKPTDSDTGFEINGNSLSGIFIANGETINITNVSNVTDFFTTGTGGFLANDGTVNITNSVFTNNRSLSAGGVLRNMVINTSTGYNLDAVINVTDSVFSNNVGGSFGSAILSNAGTANFTNITATENTNGAIGNVGELNITGGTFSNNSGASAGGSGDANASGGVIRNHTTGILNINTTDDTQSTLFSNNSAADGGAIFNKSVGSTADIRNANFQYNKATNAGGAVYNTENGTISNLTGSFTANRVTGFVSDIFGGAIYNNYAKIINIEADFTNNYLTTNKTAFGGAIYNGGDAEIEKITGDFTGNYISNYNILTGGSAIYNENSTIGTIKGSFTNNYSKSGNTNVSGGAIFNTNFATIDNIESDFTGNYASTPSGTVKGGAIYNEFGSEIKNISGDFLDNYSETTSGVASGGAIYTDGVISISATDKDMYFSGNYTNSAGVISQNAVYIGTSGFLTIKSENGYDVIFNDAIEYAGGASTNTSFSSANGANGRLVVNNDFNNINLNVLSGTLVVGEENIYTATDYTGDGARDIDIATLNPFTTAVITMYDQTALDMSNDVIQTTDVSSLVLNGGINYSIDVDLVGGVADKLNATTFNANGQIINLNEINITSNKDGETEVLLSDVSSVQQAIRLDANETITSGYDAISYDFDNTNGKQGILTILGGSVANLADMVQLDSNDKLYTLSALETVDDNLGNLQGDILNVAGDNFAIDGDGFNGINVADTQEYNLLNVSEYYGFTDYAVENDGDVSITANTTNTTFGTDSEIYNTGDIDLITSGAYKIIFEESISGDPLNVGNIYINGNVEFNDIVSNNNIILNDGVLNFAATSALSGNSILTLNGGYLDLRGNGTNTTALGNDLLINSDISYGMDIDLTDNTADKISVANVNSASIGKLLIQDLNIEYSLPSSVPFTINIADDIIKEYIDLSTTVSVLVNGSIATDSGNYLLDYSELSGDINFAYLSINDAVKSASSDKTYTMGMDETATGNLLAMGGDVFNINGGGNSILGDGFNGMSVGATQTLNIEDVLSIDGFTTGFITDNLGTINITANTIDADINGNIVNNASLNLMANNSNNITMDSVSGNGDLFASGDGSIEFTGTVVADNITATATNIEFDENVSVANTLSVDTGDVIFAKDVSANDLIINTGTSSATFDGNVTTNIFIASEDIALDGILDANNINISNSAISLGTNGFIAPNSNLTLNNATLNFNNSVINTTDFQDVNLSGTNFYSLDVSLSGTPSADIINADNITGTGKIELGNINILTDATLMPITTLKIASANFADKIDISNANLIAPIGSLENYLGYLLSYDNAGNLGLSYDDLNTAISSAVAQKTYNANATVGITNDLIMGGDVLTINANGADITRDGTNIIEIANAGQILNINNANEFNPFITSIGTVEFTDTAEINGAIVNNGVLNLTATTTSTTQIYGAISGTGNIDLTGSGGYVFNSTVSGTTLDSNSGGAVFKDSVDLTVFNSVANLSVFESDLTADMLFLLSSSTVTLESGFTGDIIFDSGTLNADQAIISETSKLITYPSGGTLNLAGGNISDIKFDTIDLNADLNLDIDISLSGTPSADKITATNVAGTGTIYLKNIDIITDASMMPLNNIMISDDVLGAKIDISGATLNNAGSSVENYAGYLIYYNNAGKLGLYYDDLDAAVSSIVAQKTYNFVTASNITSDLTMGGGTLTINAIGLAMGGDYDITISDSTQVLNINNVSSVEANFINNGTLNIVNNFMNSVFSGDFSGTGDIDINSGNKNITFDGTINQTGGDFEIDGNAIFNNSVYVNNMIINSGNIEFNAATSGNITVGGGHAYFGNNFDNGTITLGAGNLMFEPSFVIGANADLNTTGDGNIDLSNGAYQDLNFQNINLAGNTNIQIDLNLGTNQSDKIGTNNVSGSGKLTINELNIYADASSITDAGKDIQFAYGDLLTGDYIDLASGADLNINNNATATEDYENGYFISYNDTTGNLNFKFANINYAFESNVADKAYSFNQNTTIDSALVLNGDSLTMDGNDATLSGVGSIDLNGKELSVRETIINGLDIDVNNGTLGLYTDTTLNNNITGNGTVNIFNATINNADLSGFTGNAILDGNLTIGNSFDASHFFGGIFTVNNASSLNLQNGIQNIFDTTNWTLNGNLNTDIDVDLLNGWADGFINTTPGGTYSINITGIKILNDKSGDTTISLTDNTGAGNITLDANATAVGGIYTYTIDSSALDTNGTLIFSEDTLTPVSFTPAVFASTISAQTQYLATVSLHKQVFGNFGMPIIPSKFMEYGDESNNKNSALWFQPFVSDETIELDNGYSVESRDFGMTFGYNVENYYYDTIYNPTKYGSGSGSYYGGESVARQQFNNDKNMFNANKFWRANYGVFGNYTNSALEYEDVQLNKHSFNLGLTAFFNRGDSFIGTMANVGASMNDIMTVFGSEDFMGLSGAGSLKMGHNFNIGGFTIQPNVMASYVYVNTPEYTTAANIDLSKYSFSALQITPEIKMSTKLGGKWVGYAAASYNENLMGTSTAVADTTQLPDIATESYAEFTVGLQKQVIYGLDSFIEIDAMTGGRNGFGISIGMRKPI